MLQLTAHLIIIRLGCAMTKKRDKICSTSASPVIQIEPPIRQKSFEVPIKKVGLALQTGKTRSLRTRSHTAIKVGSFVRNASNFSINQQATVYLLDHFKQQNALWGLESLSEHLIPQSSKLSNLLGKPDTKELIDFPNFNSALYS